MSPGSDLFSSVTDPYQILGPTSSRLANPGELSLVTFSFRTGTIPEGEPVPATNFSSRESWSSSHISLSYFICLCGKKMDQVMN